MHRHTDNMRCGGPHGGPYESLNMPRRAFRLCLCAAAIGVDPGGAAGNPFDLAPRLTPGRTIHYVSRGNVHHRVRVDLADVDEKVLVRTESGMSLTVTDVASNGAAVVTWVLHYVAIETDGAMPGIAEALDYDSRRPRASASPLAPMFARIIENPVAVTVSPVGKVLDFQGMAAPSGGGPLDALAAGFFSREAFEQLPLFVTAGAPRPAKVRADWKQSTTVQMPLGAGTLEMEQAFTFPRISPRRGMANIAMKGTIRKGAAAAGTGGPVSSFPGDALNVEAGTLAGQYTWDLGAGWLESAETRLELRTTLNSVLGPMQLEQRMTSTVRHVAAREAGTTEPPPQPTPTESPASPELPESADGGG